MASSILSRPTLLVISCLGLIAAACSTESSSEDPIAGDTADITAKKGADKVKQCFGTEPFWSVAIEDKTIKFELLGEATRTIENKGANAAIGMQASFAALYQGRTSEDPNRFMNVIITDAGKDGCSDGMSDTRHAYSVSVLSGTELHVGCCN